MLNQCPVGVTLSLISNKWTFLILHELGSDAKRPSALKRSLEGISQKVLTENLRSMEEHGLICRKSYNEVPPKVEYSLTDLGSSLLPILDEMYVWGKQYMDAMHLPTA